MNRALAAFVVLTPIAIVFCVQFLGYLLIPAEFGISIWRGIIIGVFVALAVWSPFTFKVMPTYSRDGGAIRSARLVVLWSAFYTAMAVLMAVLYEQTDHFLFTFVFVGLLATAVATAVFAEKFVVEDALGKWYLFQPLFCAATGTAFFAELHGETMAFQSLVFSAILYMIGFTEFFKERFPRSENALNEQESQPNL